MFCGLVRERSNENAVAFTGKDVAFDDNNDDVDSTINIAYSTTTPFNFALLNMMIVFIMMIPNLLVFCRFGCT